MALWPQVQTDVRFLLMLAVLLSPLWGHVWAVRYVRRRMYGAHTLTYVHPAYRRPTRGEHRR